MTIQRDQIFKTRYRLRQALLVSVAILLSGNPARADFYRYVGKDGVEIYTNIPTGEDAVRVLREQEEAKKSQAARERRAAAAKANAQAQERAALLQSEAKPAVPESYLPVTGVVTSRVGWRRDPVDGTTRHHNGVDVAVPVGTSVKAIATGTVVESGWHGGYGNLVAIDHGDGRISMYGHNSQLWVRAGEQVQGGQVIAYSGSTGRSTGPHLHFELWKNGANVTEAYLRKGAGAPELAAAEVAASGLRPAEVRPAELRSYVKGDGSIVLTNKY